MLLESCFFLLLLPNRSLPCHFKTQRKLFMLLYRHAWTTAMLCFKGLSQVSMAHFQFVQTAAHLLTPNASSTTVTLASLQWLPVKSFITFEVIWTVYNCSGHDPDYTVCLNYRAHLILWGTLGHNHQKTNYFGRYTDHTEAKG